MTVSNTRMLEPMAEFRSTEASLWFGQLEALTRRLWETVDGADATELAWQPEPGTNTIGMLLAHIPIAESFWAAELAEKAYLCEQLLGIGPEDDGLPLPEGGAPPATLAGKTLPFYRDLMLRAREYTRGTLSALEDRDLAREIERRGRAAKQIVNGRWLTFRMVDHLAGHLGQIALLRHLYRIRSER